MIRKALILFAITSALAGCQGEVNVGFPEGVTEYASPPETPGGTTNPDGTPVDPGAEISLHRLNRLEYNNSVRDLLGTRLTPADTFPPDAALGGFDNAKQALGMTPALLTSYVDAARDVVEDAFSTRPRLSDFLDETNSRLEYSVNPEANTIGGIVRLRGGQATGIVIIPRRAQYSIRVRAQGVVNGGAPRPNVRLTVGPESFDYQPPLEMSETTFDIELPGGGHDLVIRAMNFEENAAANSGNDILLDYVHVVSEETIEGPYNSKIECDLEDEVCRRGELEKFARLAWRGPLTDDEVSKLRVWLATFTNEGESGFEATKLAFRAVLTSPRFLYRFRTDGAADPSALLDPYVLATRLSYFIWSSTPDERLLEAAADGTLGTREGVRSTVSWMLDDPKAHALADGFAEQWLDIRHLQQVAPSPQVYPQFDERLRESMAEESRLFFLDYLKNGAPVASMLQPDFVHRDALLATHLNVEGPNSEGFERLAAGPGDRRGLLSLSAWLTSRSDSEHSSPIRRGAWLADNMLCSPVPPPPPGLVIGMIPDASSGLTLRERLEQHRNDPACATCHANLDVLGMGFEVYDGVAREIDDPTLDSMGELRNFGTFRGADELARAVEPAEFVDCVSQKLMSYALGRPASRVEVSALEGITADAVTLPDLVAAIVLSPTFSAQIPLE